MVRGSGLSADSFEGISGKDSLDEELGRGERRGSGDGKGGYE